MFPFLLIPLNGKTLFGRCSAELWLDASVLAVLFFALPFHSRLTRVQYLLLPLVRRTVQHAKARVPLWLLLTHMLFQQTRPILFADLLLRCARLRSLPTYWLLVRDMVLLGWLNVPKILVRVHLVDQGVLVRGPLGLRNAHHLLCCGG